MLRALALTLLLAAPAAAEEAYLAGAYASMRGAVKDVEDLDWVLRSLYAPEEGVRQAAAWKLSDRAEHFPAERAPLSRALLTRLGLETSSDRRAELYGAACILMVRGYAGDDFRALLQMLRLGTKEPLAGARREALGALLYAGRKYQDDPERLAASLDALHAAIGDPDAGIRLWVVKWMREFDQELPRAAPAERAEALAALRRVRLREKEPELLFEAAKSLRGLRAEADAPALVAQLERSVLTARSAERMESDVQWLGRAEELAPDEAAAALTRISQDSRPQWRDAATSMLKSIEKWRRWRAGQR